MDIRKLFGWSNSSTLGGTADPGWYAPPKRDYVSIETAEQNMAIYRAIKLISHDLGRLPVDAEGGDMTSDLLVTPNDKETWFDFTRKHMRFLMLYGNSFALISRNGYGEVVGLISASPGELSQIQIDQDPGNFSYRHSTFGNIEPEDILHWRVQGQRPFWGASPIVEASRALNLAQVQEDAGESMYRTPGLGKVSIESPEAIGPDMVSKLQDAFKAKHGGKDGHLTPIITQGGMTVSQVGQSLSDSEWITARRFSIGEVARLYSVPPSFLYDLDKSTLENSAAQMKSYVSTCLSHWSAIFNSEFQLKLNSTLRWDTKNLLQGTLKETTESLRMAIDAGIMTPNEAREQLGLDAHPDGEQLMISKNYQEAGVTGTDTNAGDKDTSNGDKDTD